MVAIVVRLKLTLLKNSLRRSIWRTVGMIIGGVYGLGLVAAAIFGIVALRLWAPADIAADVLVLAFAMLTGGWLFFSLLVFGVDETVDPAKFALLPVRAGELQPGLLIAGLIGIPGVATTLVALAMIIGYARDPASIIAAVVVVPFGVASCFLLARTATTVFARVLSSRRFRDLAFVLLAVLGAGSAVLGNLSGGLAGASLDQLRAILGDSAEVAGWLPVGWLWSVPAEVGRGGYAVAVIKLLLGLAMIIGLWLVWRHFLAQRLVEPIEGGGEARKVKQGRLVERLYPATPAGGVGFRTLIYWRRDPRYIAGIAGFLILPLALIATQIANPNAGSRPLIAFAPVLLGLFVSVSLAQDLSYDGSAIWLHISSGLSGADDRAGRVYSGLTLLGPLLLAVTVISLAISGQWHLTSQVLALVVGLTLIGFGVGSFVGALWQWPAPPPGSSPFQKGNSGGLPALLSFLVSSGLSIGLGLPLIALVVASFWVGWLAAVALVVGIVGGLVVLRYGIRLGGRRLERRWPEVMAAVSERAG
ncbi:hypothetical protein [Microlunatus parietis]|uniref:ABC-2 type transport system permease protein n=1 Tax=Microlunatus parietis TaxID=682979 RepID=A0A7Y9I6V5_9ACTN|nr:hypothetical protein [Microlunatus parietis]NYE71091.1 ABC-2 type transport system permease protein [Microlunatus parietis]